MREIFRKQSDIRSLSNASLPAKRKKDFTEIIKENQH
jgi:hypothetical protein